MKKIALSLSLLAVLVVLVFIACSKDDSGKSTTVKVRLTDNPVNAEEVNVDIRQVSVKFSDDSIHGWVNLNTYAGVYDLLGLQNGVDTLLAVGVIPTNVVKEIRFVLELITQSRWLASLIRLLFRVGLSLVLRSKLTRN